jgi:hypothetical protein
MKVFYCILALTLTTFSFAQNTAELVVFSDNGEPFYLVMNGVYQNAEPKTNVRIQGLTDEYYNTRILCPNNTFELQKNIMVQRGSIVTYRFFEKDGEYKLRYFSESPMESYPTNAAQSVIVFHATGAPPAATTTTTTTTTTTNTNTNTMNTGANDMEGVNINMQISENGMNVGVHTTDGVNSNTNMSVPGSTSTYSEVTTTTTTTTTTSGGELSNNTNPNTNTNYTNYSNCALDAAGFERLKSAIEKESFSDGKLRVANGAAKNKCLTVAQIKEVAGLFSFSSEILSFTKAAYTNCQNRDDYYEVMEVFTFSGDKEELQEYIDSH